MNRATRPRPNIAAIPFHLPQGSGLRLEHFSEAAVTEALEAHAETVRRGGEGVLKRDHRSHITAAVAGGRPVVVKEVVKGGARRCIADRFRGSPARRAWRGGHGLLALGIGACTPLAFFETSRRGFLTASSVILEDLRPAIPSPDYAARGRAEAQAVLDALCRLAIALHSRRVAYADFRAQHVFVQGTRDPDAGPVETALVDLESVRFAARLSETHRIQRLAELNASLADGLLPNQARLRAFETYCRALPFAHGKTRALANVVRRSLAREHLWSAAGCDTRRP